MYDITVKLYSTRLFCFINYFHNRQKKRKRLKFIGKKQALYMYSSICYCFPFHFSVVLDEVAHHELPHLDLHCLQIQLLLFVALKVLTL